MNIDQSINLNPSSLEVLNSLSLELNSIDVDIFEQADDEEFGFVYTKGGGSRPRQDYP